MWKFLEKLAQDWRAKQEASWGERLDESSYVKRLDPEVFKYVEGEHELWFSVNIFAIRQEGEPEVWINRNDFRRWNLRSTPQEPGMEREVLSEEKSQEIFDKITYWLDHVRQWKYEVIDDGKSSS